ncbi:phospholipase D-like domain-containing protein [Lichenicoccus roseus]|uniref:Phospholipase D n=1 Tax=Lichenicoccus roseus TaxID=2683649 RepID=A0A5R9J9M8_9PROT|nr:phospholipase D-like domain-containing protein [Lichenicoccus roseus]TLU74272.1 cardiolipin synthase [Lichenicoccus roseus]
MSDVARLFDDVLWPLRIVIPICVTLHALRTKREIGAAIGWIGLSWLAPIFGGLLYLMFGINRVRRLAQRLSNVRPWSSRRGAGVDAPVIEGNLAPLVRAVERLTGRPLLPGNKVRCFHDGDDAYPVMLEAIEQAKQSLLLCSYIFRADRIGTRFIEAIAAAQQRGVAVRILVDGIGSGYFASGAAKELHRRGVPVARFMHSTLPWRMPFINLRTHKKILVLDGCVGFTGGMNIAAENVLRIRPRHPVSDTHFRIEGPLVHQLTEAFAKDWSFTTGEDLDEAAFYADPPVVGAAFCRVVTSGPDADLEKIEFAMMQGIALARSSIRIMTPYFLPDERLLTVLAMSAMRGVTIDLVLPKESNHRAIDWARTPNNIPLLDAGVRIWLSEPPFNHSKLMVVDEKWSFIGSANQDVRSLRLNFELNVEVHDTELARELDAFICAHRHERYEAERTGQRSFPVRIRDSAARLMLPYL